MNKIVGIGGTAYDMLSMIDRMPTWEEIEYIDSYDVQQGGMVATALGRCEPSGRPDRIRRRRGRRSAGRLHAPQLQEEQGGLRSGEDLLRRKQRLHHRAHPERRREKRTFVHNKGVNLRPVLTDEPIDLTGTSHVIFDGFYFRYGHENRCRGPEARDRKRHGHKPPE